MLKSHMSGFLECCQNFKKKSHELPYNRIVYFKIPANIKYSVHSINGVAILGKYVLYFIFFLRRLA